MLAELINRIMSKGKKSEKSMQQKQKRTQNTQTDKLSASKSPQVLQNLFL